MDKLKPYYVKYLILDKKYGSHPGCARFDTLQQWIRFTDLIRFSKNFELCEVGREGT